MIKRTIPVTTFLFFAGLLISLACAAQKGNPVYSKETEDKIKQVENNLSRPLHIYTG
jgi:hypothetical protein